MPGPRFLRPEAEGLEDWSHDAGLLARVPGFHGEVHMDAPPAKVFSHVQEMRDLGLDVPQPTELCDLLRQSGYDLDPEIMTPEAAADAIAKLLGGA